MDTFAEMTGQTARDFIAQANPATEEQARSELSALAKHLGVGLKKLEAAFDKSLNRKSFAA